MPAVGQSGPPPPLAQARVWPQTGSAAHECHLETPPTHHPLVVTTQGSVSATRVGIAPGTVGYNAHLQHRSRIVQLHPARRRRCRHPKQLPTHRRPHPGPQRPNQLHRCRPSRLVAGVKRQITKRENQLKEREAVCTVQRAPTWASGAVTFESNLISCRRSRKTPFSDGEKSWLREQIGVDRTVSPA